VDELDYKYLHDLKSNTLLKNKLELLKYKVGLYSHSNADDGKRAEANEMIKRFKKVMMAIIEHERTRLHTFRKKEEFDDSVIRMIENRLDLEEEGLQQETE
jgi:hypothetical protein